VRLDVELARAGTTRWALTQDVQDVVELRETCKPLRHNEAALLRLALEWFGDRGEPQPERRRGWGLSFIEATSEGDTYIELDGKPAAVSRTPSFGKLPRLDNDDAPDTDVALAAEGELSQAERLKGSYATTDAFWAAWEMACNGASANRIDKDTKTTPRYLNRDKAGVIVKRVRADPTAAWEALRLRKLPQGFAQTPAGVRLPPLRSQ
jgi:hypothetical protein